MRLVKKKLNNTYTGEDGKEHQAYGYFVEADNGKLLRIRTWFKDDYKKLDFLCEYQG